VRDPDRHTIETTGHVAVASPGYAEELRARLRGELLLPTDPGYDPARHVYNGMIDKRPSAIARVADVADVIACVDCAREEGIALAVRGGGHNVAGLGTVDGGLVVDLGRIRGVHVDPRSATVRVGGGCVWGEVDHATHAFGLAVPNGVFSTTGVGGLTLGGGTGYLTRAFGLTIDNLLEAELVLADGRVVTASADANADLFWALRGGGGNFGVVTSFLFRAHPVTTVVGGSTFWPMELAEAALSGFQRLLSEAPVELGGFFAFACVPPVPAFPEELHGRNASGAVWCFNGPRDAFDRLVAPLLGEAEPLVHAVHEMPFPALQSMFDPLGPAGLQHYWRADYMPALSSDAIRAHARLGGTLPTRLSQVHLYPVTGAAGGVDPSATAYRHRDAVWSQTIIGTAAEPAGVAALRQWVGDYHAALHPYSVGAAYVNFLMEEGDERVRAAYGGNFDRLAGVKRRYDPGNLFQVNHNIPPGRPDELTG